MNRRSQYPAGWLLSSMCRTHLVFQSVLTGRAQLFSTPPLFSGAQYTSYRDSLSPGNSINTSLTSITERGHSKHVSEGVPPHHTDVTSEEDDDADDGVFDGWNSARYILLEVAWRVLYIFLL